MSSTSKRSYHFVGVAGVGMSAVAQVMLAEGYDVSGSDRDMDSGKDLDVVRKLILAGVKFMPQDGSGLSSSTAGVVVSTAIEKDNPDLVAAGRLSISVIHRSEMLARLVEGKRCIAVTGTSGKSTVTGMLGCILEQIGADPVVVNGAAVLNWCDDNHVGNVRHGESDLWIIEADESDRSLLNFHPDWAVITNVARDHFDLEETVDLFEKFSLQVKKGIVNALDEPGLLAEFRPHVSAGSSSFVYKGTEFVVPVPGRHNAENAFLAIALCERMGYELGSIRRALKKFKGIQRRLEAVGEARGVSVIDDYAHNPMKIKAALQTVSSTNRRVIGIWRPHGYRPLVSMMDDLVKVFAESIRKSDLLIVLPVYDAGGTANRAVNADVLVDKLKVRGVAASFSPDLADAIKAVSAVAEPGDVVLSMGARDPGLSEFARNILEAIRSK